ncbi:MAG: 6,7-dimethyl-8-ribityllumazine synthase [Candidatus Kapabacteria bacterium]|nr:6,7-dimethyl-8-ribityllumazine synthase [Candidatus Kapabacteria bacterium]
MTRIEGTLNAAGLRVAIVATRWNDFIVNRLLDGATDALRRHGADENDITIAYCPGAYEIPLVVSELAMTKNYDAVIALGCVIRGATAHFEYVAGAAATGIASAMNQSRVPCLFGVLTTDTIEQAIERAGTKAGNKGFECAVAAIEMATLMKSIRR